MSKKDPELSVATLQHALMERGANDILVEVFDSLPSTSEYLRAVASSSVSDKVALSESSCADPTMASQLQLCVTDWQTNGNGRRGKTWVTERGNVTFSMLVPTHKPPAELMGLSLVTGICVAESLFDLAGVAVQLKWPNDVLVEDKKLCGLLTELVSGTGGVTNIVAGIGVNVTTPVSIETSDYGATSLQALCSATPERSVLIADICVRVRSAYDMFTQQGWSVFADRWNKIDYLKGRHVRVLNAGEEKQAIAIGVDDNGALLIKHNEQTSAVYSGEVSVRIA